MRKILSTVWFLRHFFKPCFHFIFIFLCLNRKIRKCILVALSYIFPKNCVVAWNSSQKFSFKSRSHKFFCVVSSSFFHRFIKALFWTQAFFFNTNSFGTKKWKFLRRYNSKIPYTFFQLKLWTNIWNKVRKWSKSAQKRNSLISDFA